MGQVEKDVVVVYEPSRRTELGLDDAKVSHNPSSGVTVCRVADIPFRVAARHRAVDSARVVRQLMDLLQ